MLITLAQLIKEARVRARFTQKELAEICGTSMENVSAIESGRNKTPSPDIVVAMSKHLDLEISDIYSSVGGTLNSFPWDRVGDLDLKDPELELMFRQVDLLNDEEAKERVKAFIRFTLEEERRRIRREKAEKKQSQ